MTISYNWLKEYLPVDLPAEKVGEVLTDIGLEVEGIKKIDSIKGGLDGVVVGEVLTCKKHPNADRLSITTVDLGNGEPVQIVCGAPNVAAGQKVPVATVGTTLYTEDDSFKIKKGKIRGEVSEGMICAEDELGLGTNHDGIMVLDPSAQPGTPAKEYFDIETDYVFEIGLTPNRTDAMSHYGVARDLRAGLAQEGMLLDLHVPAAKLEIDNTELTIPVTVVNKEACPQYLGITISNVNVSESPEWLKKRLNAIGLKPINNVVDATNYMLHDFGHPLHAFDADKIEGNEVVVKTMASQTSFTTLDDVERKLHADDLMICNKKSAMCIGGVFGGADSGVSESTKNVFLEAAWFDPVSIRKTAKRHGLNTDASYRYERGVDPNFTKQALIRAAMMIKQLTGGKISSEIQEVISKEFPPHKVEIDLDRVNALIGNDISENKVEEILALLEIDIDSKANRKWSLSVPTYRAEVTREADIVEEILRIYGFNNIELPEQMHFALNQSVSQSDDNIRKEVSSILTANGYFEILNNSLTKKAYYDKFKANKVEHLVTILNPLSQDLGVMRQSLLFGGLEVVSHNLNRQTSNIKVFEFGNTYLKNGKSNYSENEELMILLSGKDVAENWDKKPVDSTFFNLKGIVEALFGKLGIANYQEQIIKTDDFSETLALTRGDKELARIGQVTDKITKYFDIDQPVFIAILNWESLEKISSKHKVYFQDLPRFPHVRRDLAMLVDNNCEYAALKNSAQKAGGKLLKEINLFDVYTGKNLPEGKKSYAMSFILQDPEQTLVDKRVDAVMNKILNSLKKEYAVELR